MSWSRRRRWRRRDVSRRSAAVLIPIETGSSMLAADSVDKQMHPLLVPAPPDVQLPYPRLAAVLLLSLRTFIYFLRQLLIYQFSACVCVCVRVFVIKVAGVRLFPTGAHVRFGNVLFQLEYGAFGCPVLGWFWEIAVGIFVSNRIELN